MSATVCPDCGAPGEEGYRYCPKRCGSTKPLAPQDFLAEHFVIINVPVPLPKKEVES